MSQYRSGAGLKYKDNEPKLPSPNPPSSLFFKRQISENVQRLVSSELVLVAGDQGLVRQESRDSLIEVALDNTEQIVSKLLGKNSRNILTARQPSLLDL